MNTLETVINRGNMALPYYNIDTTWNNVNTMVLAEVSMNLLMAVFGLTAGLTYLYDWRYWGFHT